MREKLGTNRQNTLQRHKEERISVAVFRGFNTSPRRSISREATAFLAE